VSRRHTNLDDRSISKRAGHQAIAVDLPGDEDAGLPEYMRIVIAAGATGTEGLGTIVRLSNGQFGTEIDRLVNAQDASVLCECGQRCCAGVVAAVR
jgi:hypothetical protein